MPKHKATRPTTNWRYWVRYALHKWHPLVIRHSRTTRAARRAR